MMPSCSKSTMMISDDDESKQSEGPARSTDLSGRFSLDTVIETKSHSSSPSSSKSLKSFWSQASLKTRTSPILSLTSLALCFLVACFSVQWDNRQFSQAFATDANILFTHVGTRAKQNIEAMASLGTSLTSYTTSSTVTWPFVTAPGFAMQAAHTLDILNTSSVFLSPIVHEEQRLEWEDYSNQHYQEWSNTLISPMIFEIADNGTRVADWGPGPFHPVWQIQPPTSYDVKFNLHSIPTLATALDRVYKYQTAIFTHPIPANELEANITQHLDLFSLPDQQEETEPVSLLILPVFDSFEGTTRTTVGVVVAPFLWRSYLVNSFGVDTGTRGVMAVLQSSCDPDNHTFSYQIDQDQVQFLGQGDLHHPFYSEEVHTEQLSILLSQSGFVETSDGIAFDQEYSCQYQVMAYPTAIYQNNVKTAVPVVLTVVTVVLCALTFLLFLIFGGMAEDRFEKLKHKASATSHVVDTLFPKEIQNRLFNLSKDKNHDRDQIRALLAASDDPRHQTLLLDDDPLAKIKGILGDPGDHDDMSNSPSAPPIADLWPNCTVMFADISGFTAWSGCREPVQVFTLLERLFKAFDEIAARRNVFKVETVGDCYVAVVGLPTPRKDHALVMTRFAFDCLNRMNKVTRELYKELGPDTAELRLRIGLNSGPVTAGVLRGHKGRFQLFGDTVNVAARMESTGMPNRIHVSETTANLLTNGGKGHWVTQREDLVEAKGKGKMKTAWVEPMRARGSGSSVASSATSQSSSVGAISTVAEEDDKAMRLIDWNVEVFAKLIKQIVAYRESNTRSQKDEPSNSTRSSATKKGSVVAHEGGTIIDEVREVLEVSTLEPSTREMECTPQGEQIERELSPIVMGQLRAFITRISLLYPDNPFHNFAHASHVTMSVLKMLSRVVTPGATDARRHGSSDSDDFSFGLKSNPLTQFAVVFGALIHDVDHPGVPNSTLVAEETPLAKKYKNKSVAEQNSLALALGLLEQNSFSELLSTICETKMEKIQLRHLVINTVMATDIMDKDLKNQRNARWEKAFSGEVPQTREEVHKAVNRKATIVLEHLIQASDVAHTMQPWHVYRNWNERLFLEMYAAFKAGRIPNDPSVGWYKGEIGFFDFYIIPLAKKLNDCGVFGVSSDEFLNYAERNRNEWEEKGLDIVAEMMQKINANAGENTPTEIEV